ncbi:MAG: carboxypeptidase regulatory-like domain-containing protein [Anaerolineales bacterium]|nr:carboxypeptidase regulatory-like domain-containing protein [Anaerolineales bacterium]
MKTLMLDVEKCIGCRNCQLACKDEHVGNDWLPIASSQSEGQFWMWIDQSERGKQPKVHIDWLAVTCQQCEDAPCMAACQSNAIYRRPDGIILIDPKKCSGDQDCIAACPYGVIYFNPESNIAQKCTLCAHLLDRGWKEPRCVTACPTEALTFVDEEQVQALDGRKEYLKPEENTRPRMVYLGLPKPFLAGEVFSPTEDLCLEGVIVRATPVGGGESLTVQTNNYGDFSVKGLTSAAYNVSFEKEGYYPKQISSLKIGEALNIGEVKLYKKA